MPNAHDILMLLNALDIPIAKVKDVLRGTLYLIESLLAHSIRNCNAIHN